MAETVTTKYNAPALDKGLDILEHLSEVGVPLSQAEIAQGINRTPSEIYRMLICLEERGYLLRGSNAGKYRLSLKMYSLSHRHTPFDELKRVALYPMQELSETTRQSCHLSILDNDRLLIIAQTRSPSAVSLSIEEGTHFPLSMTTSGRVLLSRYEETDREAILARDEFYVQWNDKEQEQFLASVKEIEQKGYRVAKSKLTSGITDIGIPIGLKNSNLIAVLAVSVFTSSLEDELKIEELLKALEYTQSEINRLIGG
ncbi:MAG: IclR family transcriptional regulator [Maribacter sp.]|uniref:IclR family transcriptional regulator n=1 Tax=Maribacter sp. TaxID=1897614 RepID=UPI003C7707E9